MAAEYYKYVQMRCVRAIYEHFMCLHLTVVFTDPTFHTFATIHAFVRSATAQRQTQIPFHYEYEPFFRVYEALFRVWKKRESQRKVATESGLGRDTIREWEEAFLRYGAIGFLRMPKLVEVDPRLERLVLLARQARPKTGSAHISTLARALGIPGADLEIIRRIQRSHGYGQRRMKRIWRFTPACKRSWCPWCTIGALAVDSNGMWSNAPRPFSILTGIHSSTRWSCSRN